MRQVADAATETDEDPYSRENLRDPYPLMSRLRKAGPLVRLTKYGIWSMARYEQVHAALNDPVTYESAGGVGLTDIRNDPNPMMARRLTLEIDAPDHAKYRSVLTRALSPVMVRKMRQDFAAHAGDLVERLLGREVIDGVKDVAEAYPLQVFPDAVGLQQEGREHLLQWSRVIFNSFGPMNDVMKESMPAGIEAQKWVVDSCRRENVVPGSLAGMIYQAADRREITEEEAPLLVRPFLTAGLDTTISAIGSMLYAFASFPDQYKKVRDEPSLARAAFEEAVRWNAPFQAFCRTTGRDVEVAGKRLARGTKVLLFPASANRDPARWNAPDMYDVTRDTQGHVGFGSGIHACVGQMVARLEGELIVAALIKRVASIKLDGAPVPDVNNTMRAFASLPIRLVAA